MSIKSLRVSAKSGNTAKKSNRRSVIKRASRCESWCPQYKIHVIQLNIALFQTLKFMSLFMQYTVTLCDTVTALWHRITSNSLNPQMAAENTVGLPTCLGDKNTVLRYLLCLKHDWTLSKPNCPIAHQFICHHPDSNMQFIIRVQSKTPTLVAAASSFTSGQETKF